MGVILGAVFAILLILSVPIPFALCASTLSALFVKDFDFVVFAQRMVVGSDSFSLLAVPLFILAGELMQRGGLSARLINFANALIGHIRGGLSAVTVVSATFFAAISGSAPATTAAIGSIMISEMEKKGYSRDFGAGLAAAAGPIGQIIPPSIPMVIWGVMSNTSISKLFLAGIIPGILLAMALMIVGYVIVCRRGYQQRGVRTPLKGLFWAFQDGFFAILTPVIILGGIYGGIFTPTEAAAVSVVYGVIVGMFIYKELKLRDVPPIFFNAVKTTSMCLFIVAVANLFGWLMAKEQLSAKLATLLFDLAANPILVLLCINILLLIIGCVMDNIAAMVILAPVLSAVGAQLALDPVQLGLIVVLNFAIGQTTPPIGYTLFVSSSISGLALERVIRAVIPFVLAEVSVLLLVTYWPALTLSILDLVYGN